MAADNKKIHQEKPPMASSSNASNPKSFKYQVFISYRGEDTRKTFVDHLYASLKQLGIHTFRDNEELEEGNQIEELFKAIEESRFLIIIFSQNYASSSWCLKELTKIMECEDGNQQIAYPLFYDVEPSDIRYQSGPVGRAIAKHKTNDQIKNWEKALQGAGNLVGWDLKNIANGHEAEAVNQIVKEISQELRSIRLGNDENVIGMDRWMQVLESSLGIGLNDKSRMIGIKGMGGIGKTTLARAVFNKLSSHFEGSIFIEGVRELSRKKDLCSLQELILSYVLNNENIRVGSVYEGERLMRMRLPYKKVLLVLDDVDDAKQLEALAGDWFKDGSRIIITTRDEKVLLAHGVNVNWIHDVSLLSDEEAMSLFCRYAFKSYIPDEGYEELSSEVVRYAAGLPLTIKVLGSHLRGAKKVVWRDALKRLETIPSQETLEVLELSYNSLEDDHKEMFLDIACFLKEFPKEHAVRVLDSCGFRAEYGLRILEQKSLIMILNDKYGTLSMHDRVVELGKNIVRQSHPHEPNKHNRLWIEEEIEELFYDDEGTEASTCIGLELYPKELSPDFIINGLGNLNKLRYLFLNGKHDDCFPSDWKFDESKQYFPNSLQYLLWKNYPGLSLPQTFRANNLVTLQLPGSKIVRLWESGERKVLKKLRHLHLNNTKIQTLDLGMTPNLEILELNGCHDLVEIHAPAGCLERLLTVDLRGCRFPVAFSLVNQLESIAVLVKVQCLEGFEFPVIRFEFQYFKRPLNSIGLVSDVVFLDLLQYDTLESVSGNLCSLQNLIQIKFEGPIPELPNDMDQLKSLQQISLLNTHIKRFPDSVWMLKHLKSITIFNCKHFEELPENLGLLEKLFFLSLCSTGIRRLPDSICMLKNLKILRIEYCGLLEKLPEDIGELESLEKLKLTKCESLGDIPYSICKMKHLRFLHLANCSQVEKLPEDFGNLKGLEELDIQFTGIRRLPHSISSLKGLCIFGSISLLRSCDFATEIQSSEKGTFCYI
ncbi:hypothetical protein LXL04_010700 [Taraxacum kok-saghyz]